MTALIRMRLSSFVRGGRALAPLIAVLVVLSVIYGGGASPAAVAYSYSATALFPILAWLTKLILDTEPDVQRRLARITLGPAREALNGILAAATLALAICAAAMVAPWLFSGIDTTKSLGPGLALGVLAHLLAVPPALAVGAVASRPVTRSTLTGVTILVSAAVLVVVLGLQNSFAPWLVPPIMATARALNEPAIPSAATLALFTTWAALWCAVVFTAYGRLRRSRS